MKNISFVKVVILAVSIAMAGYFIGDTLWKAKKNNRVVVVKGLAEKEVKANLAVWPMKITITGDDLISLNKKIESQKNTVIAFFKSKGFTNTEISSGITNITDAKANLYNNDRPNFRYVANTEITLRTSDIKKIKTAQKGAVDLMTDGILITSKNQWNPISYTYTKLNTIKPQMIEEATKNAKAVAQKFAKDSNSSVGKIKTASQGLFSIYNIDENTPDIKKIRVVTTVSYFLKD